jgi:hypothetical protein
MVQEPLIGTVRASGVADRCSDRRGGRLRTRGREERHRDAACDGRTERRRLRLPASARCADRHSVRRQVDLDRTIGVCSEDAFDASLEPRDRRGRRMAVGISRACGDDRDGRCDGVEERRRRRCSAAVVRDLEQINVRDPAGEKDRVNPLLDVAGEQESPPADVTQEDDADVVDARARVRGLAGNRPRVRPQHAKTDVVEGEAVARR